MVTFDARRRSQQCSCWACPAFTVTAIGLLVGGATVLAHREDAEHLAVVGNRGAVPGALYAFETVAGRHVLLIEIFDVGHAVDIVAVRREAEIELEASGSIVAEVSLARQAVVGVGVVVYVCHVARGVGHVAAVLADVVLFI